MYSTSFEKAKVLTYETSKYPYILLHTEGGLVSTEVMSAVHQDLE